MSPFEQAFIKTIDHEKGYSADPRDPGGETKFGISKRSYPNENIRDLTIERAKLIYLKDYWQPAMCHRMPAAVAIEVFDAAINCGVGQAIRFLQRALGVADDGVVGPVTIAAINSAPSIEGLLARFHGQRLMFHTDLKNWPNHGRGWAKRIAKNLMEVK